MLPSAIHRFEFFARLGVHVLVDPKQTLGENLDVVIAVDVLPDVLDDLGNGERSCVRGSSISKLETFLK